MSGFIYFIACEPLEAVKIGFTTKSPLERLAALQTGSPAPLKLLCYVEGTQDEERRLHRSFAKLSIHREWFRRECALWDFIGYLTRHELQPRLASREEFLNALHDCLMQGGGWHPGSPVSYDEYFSTRDWEPFRKELWDAFGPWDE